MRARGIDGAAHFAQLEHTHEENAMSFQVQVDLDGNWAVGLVGCRVLEQSAKLPRQDRSPMDYDVNAPNTAHAVEKAKQLAVDYASGMC